MLLTALFLPQITDLTSVESAGPSVSHWSHWPLWSRPIGVLNHSLGPHPYQYCGIIPVCSSKKKGTTYMAPSVPKGEKSQAHDIEHPILILNIDHDCEGCASHAAKIAQVRDTTTRCCAGRQ